MSRYFIQSGGGIGDLIYNYLGKRGMDGQWVMLDDLVSNGDHEVTAILCCHSAEAYSLIELDPRVSNVLIFPWKIPGDPYELGWMDVIDRSLKPIPNGLRASNPKIYLSDMDREIIKRIPPKYIAIHPFAGIKDRVVMDMMFYRGLTSCLAELGYWSVYVGKSQNDNTIRSFVEEVPVNHPMAIDLVNKTNLRQSVEICRNASGFIGMHSSMLAAAWSNAVPNIFFYPTDGGKTIKGNGGETGNWAMDMPWTRFYEGPSGDIGMVSPDDVAMSIESLMGGAS